MIVQLDNMRRQLATFIARTLAGLNIPITPNQITVARFLIAAPSSLYFFSHGTYWYNLMGLAIYLPLAVMDFVDGEFARLTNQTSNKGKFLDDNMDVVLMLIVIGSLFYAGLNSPQQSVWIYLTPIFFSVFYFLTALTHNFDNQFNLELRNYSNISNDLFKMSKKPSFWDLIFVNFVDIQRSSVSRFCFAISYSLLLGIIANQILLTFVFISVMWILRAVILVMLMYKVAEDGTSSLKLISILKKYASSKK